MRGEGGSVVSGEYRDFGGNGGWGGNDNSVPSVPANMFTKNYDNTKNGAAVPIPSLPAPEPPVITSPPSPPTPPPPPPPQTPKTYTSIIFVKTYKTASTTVAMILNSIAFKLRLNCLHPLSDGENVGGDAEF